ncbi:hypothetical protein ACV8VM_001886 [Vibrio parahaemolyticus]|nr:hypothetical protein [Vibrio parahaemolyticus]EGV2727983.1 hypothetical protein [Vibrio parahaemolyticus]EHR7858822.1 hypothetical protein [Vibrio parahaemolyticus]
MAPRKNSFKPRIPRNKPKTGLTLRLKSNETVFAPVHVEHFKTGFDEKNLTFLRQLQSALTRFDEITISFKYTERLKAPAVLVVYSIIDTYGKGKKIDTILSDRSEEVNESIRSSGAFKTAEERLKMLDENQLPVIQGNNAIVNKLSRTIIKTLVDLYLDKESENFSSRKSEIGTAIIETLDNVGRHAYPDKDHHEKLWWFCCDIIDDTLFMAIYDNGVGIPHSIRNSKIDFTKLMESYYSLTGKDITKLEPTVTANKAEFRDTYSDPVLIGAAMSEDLSKTTKDKHGKGSGSMKALIKEEEGSFLIIGSGKGMYTYSKCNREHERVIPLRNSITGTLIQWSL